MATDKERLLKAFFGSTCVGADSIETKAQKKAVPGMPKKKSSTKNKKVSNKDLAVIFDKSRYAE